MQNVGVSVVDDPVRLGYTMPEFARLVGRSPRWVRQQVRDGFIPVVWVGPSKLVPYWFAEQFVTAPS